MKTMTIAQIVENCNNFNTEPYSFFTVQKIIALFTNKFGFETTSETKYGACLQYRNETMLFTVIVSRSPFQQFGWFDFQAQNLHDGSYIDIETL